MENKYLIVVDMQNDFITGPLGSTDAQEIVPKVVDMVNNFSGEIILTQDTHFDNYLDTVEGKMLPIVHALRETFGWEFPAPLQALQKKKNLKVYEKNSFGCLQLAKDLQTIHEKKTIDSIEFIGLLTDICIVTNVLLLKSFLPEVPISVNADKSRGSTRQKNEAALQTMESCQITIKSEKLSKQF